MTKEDNPVVRFEHPSDIVPFLQKFTSQGTRFLDIFSQSLSPALYNNQELMDAILTLARYSSHSQIRILVRNNKHLNGADCPLIGLTRKLPSKAQIRIYTEGAKDQDTGFFCVDKKHLIYFNDESNYQGFARTNAKPESKNILEEFEHLWLYGSKEDPNLRQLSI